MFFFDAEKRQRQGSPQIGDTMYCVIEHLYYDKAIQVAPFLEYVVFAGSVKRLITVRRTDIELVGKGPDGYILLEYRRLQDIGKSVFYTASEAAALAERMTADHEARWGWSDAPLRRPWEHLLKGVAQ